MNTLFHNVYLSPGPHPEAGAEMCAMEMVAWLNGEPHSDTPECSGRFITGFVQSLNDSLDDIDRQRLLPYIPRLIGTAGNEQAHRDALEKLIPDTLNTRALQWLNVARENFRMGLYLLSAQEYALVLRYAAGLETFFVVLDAMLTAGPTGEFEPKRNPLTAAIELNMVPA